MFSIIIPTFARPHQLRQCLRGVSRLRTPREAFEVIVVDDGSPDPLTPVVGPFSDQLSITLIRQPNAGPASARNGGAARARGRYLAFIDDDCVPAGDWLQTLAARFGATPDCAIGGRTLNARSDNVYSRASQLLVDYLYANYNEAQPNRAHFFTSNNVALPAASFHAVGGFDSMFSLPGGEDRDFCDRWRYHGYGMIYAPEVLVYHFQALTFYSFWRQQFNYGRGAGSFHYRRAQRSGDTGRRKRRLPPEPLSFYGNLLRFPLSQGRGIHAWRDVALFAMAQVAVSLGIVHERLRQPWEA